MLHCIRSISPQMGTNDHSLNFMHFINTFNEKAIPDNNIANAITVNSVNTIVSITIPPLFYGNFQHSHTGGIVQQHF